MGAVYLAIDLTLDIPVAIKENLGGSDSYARQFRREGSVLAGLAHPNLPRVTDHFTTDEGGQYLVMDFIAGEDLRVMIKRFGRLPEDQVIKIGSSICDALTYLHEHKPTILHRDIKPGNIKVNPDGTVFLVDFGLVKVVQGSGATTTGAQSLTPGYAPPEQYGSGTDQRSDIYSLGATLYAALTGKIPEDGITRAMGNTRLTPISRQNPDVSNNLAAVIETALSIEPGNRFQSAADFKTALVENPTLPVTIVEASKEETTIPNADTRNSSSHNHSSHSRLRLFIILGGILLLFLVISAVFLLRPKSNQGYQILPPSSVPIMETGLPATSSPEPDDEILTSTLPIATAEIKPTVPLPVIVTPPGGGKGTIAFASDRDGKPQIFLLNLMDGSVQKITNLLDGACQPDWSPDGMRLIFISPCPTDQKTYRNSSLFLINLDGTGLKGLKTTPGGDFEPDWSPDGNKVIFTSLRDSKSYITGHIYSLDLSQEKATRLTSLNLAQRSARWSPDGNLIAYEDNRNNLPQIFTMGAAGNNAQPFTNIGESPAQHPAWSPNGTEIVYIQGDSSPGILTKSFVASVTKPNSINDLFRPAGNPSYSADGYWLVFESLGEIMMMTASGLNVTILTNSNAKDFDPSWQP